MWRHTVLTSCLLLLTSRCALARLRDSATNEVCPEICEPEKCPNVGPIGLSQCPAQQYIVTYRCGCCKKCDIRPVTTTLSPNKRDEVCGEMVCPKKKMCVLNIQGLPVCRCPSVDLCKQFVSRGAGKKQRVCGSDGVTYPSRCHLKVASCISDEKIRVNHRGDCEIPSSAVELSPRQSTASPKLLVNKRKGHKKRLQKSFKVESTTPIDSKQTSKRKFNRLSEKKSLKKASRKKEKLLHRATKGN